ncbi:hypothetical protein VQ045_19620 [Aurantimonas sp. E1-2-R+4]|uniref:hypothetical protein n=1 Tax=Aurantimonas sp. E1-2-R+4 TaxID=3113714 RepID=UPI002F92E2C6
MPSNRRKPSQKQRTASTRYSGSYRGRQKALRIPVGRQIDTEIAIALIGLLVRRAQASELDHQLRRLQQAVAKRCELGKTDEKALLAIAARINRHRNTAIEGALSARPPEPVKVVEQHEDAGCVAVNLSTRETADVVA